MLLNVLETEIYEVNSNKGNWKWNIKFIDHVDECIIKKLPLYLPFYIEFDDNYIKGCYEDTLEDAKNDMNVTMDIIKNITIECNNEKKQKEIEKRIGQKFWEWDDNNNEFKEVKGDC